MAFCRQAFWQRAPRCCGSSILSRPTVPNDVLIRVRADTGDAESKIGGLRGALAGLASQTASFAAGMQLAAVFDAAVSGATSFVSNSITQASRLRESINAVNVVFGDSAAVVQSWGETTATSFGLSRQEFNALATPLGSMLKNMGTGLEETAHLTIELTKRAADMASIFDTDVRVALEAIQAGLRGEIDPLERFGVSLSAARVEARALADTGKMVASSLTDQERAAARVAEIFAQTAQVEGDFLATSDQLANAQRRANAELLKAQAALGDKLLPVMLEVTRVKLRLVDAISALIPVVGLFVGNLDKIAPVVAGIATAITVLLIPKMALAAAAIWSTVAALTAQAIAFAAANPLMAAAAVAAGVAVAAFLALAIQKGATADATKKATEATKSATDADRDSADATRAATSAVRDAATEIYDYAAALREASAMTREMSATQLATYIATQQLANGTAEFAEALPRLMDQLRERLMLERAIREGTDDLIESVTGEKAAREAARAAQEAATQARQDAAEAERKQLAAIKEINDALERQRQKLRSVAEQLFEYGRSLRESMTGTFGQLTGIGVPGAAALDIAKRIAGSDLDAAQARLRDAFTGGAGVFAGLDQGSAIAAFRDLSDALARGAAGTGLSKLDQLLGLVDRTGAPTDARISSGAITTINNIEVNGVITDPAATGRAIADAINLAANQTGPVISAGAVA